ncbi:glycosyltransferase [Paenibacillus sp. 2TAB23]|uniref:glycosyltransferase n=1 Tax=Paenibacillus sp. 2TAB23 TaxID=3233004 RepID=UPI003F95D0C2
MKEQVFVSVVLYAYNEQESIKNMLVQIDQTMSRYFYHYEIIVINDASNDLTLERIRSASEFLHGTLIVLNLARKHGVEKAMMAGLIKSMGDFVFELESTIMDFHLEQLIELYHTALKGSDIVVLTPSINPSWTSKLFYKIINKISYLNLDLRTESARLVSRRALNSMLNLKEKVRYRKALYSYTGYSKESIPYKTDKNKMVQVRKFNRENIGTAFDIIVSFSNLGLKFSHYLSIAFFLFSMFMGAYALYNYIFNAYVVQGWTTLMILISAGFAGLFFIVGMLGEYISRILIEIQDRPAYTTNSTEVIKSKIRNVNVYNSDLEVAATKQEG